MMTLDPSIKRSALGPVRILYVTARFFPERGGTEIHTHEVAQRMTDRGAVVTIAATTRSPEVPTEQMEGEVHIRRVRAFPRGRDYFFSPALPGEIRANEPDMIHIQGYHTLVAPVAMFAALRAAIPYVVTLHSGGHSSRLRTLVRPLQAHLLRPLLVRASAVVAVSEFEADLFSRRLRLPRDRFAVIPSGINLPSVPLGSDHEPDFIVSLGRLERYKGHDRVIEALPQLRQRHPALRLRIAGAGPQGPYLQRLAGKLSVADAVEIAPVNGDRSAIAGLLARAAVVVALSSYESQGLAVQEALGLGRPVVVSEGSALDELAAYPNVLTVPRLADSSTVAAAVSRLLGAPPSPTPVMQTWDQCVDALVEVYREALLGAAPRGPAGARGRLRHALSRRRGAGA